MDKILHDPKDPKLWELWYIPYNGYCRILAINRITQISTTYLYTYIPRFPQTYIPTIINEHIPPIDIYTQRYRPTDERTDRLAARQTYTLPCAELRIARFGGALYIPGADVSGRCLRLARLVDYAISSTGSKSTSSSVRTGRILQIQHHQLGWLLGEEVCKGRTHFLRKLSKKLIVLAWRKAV